jgi:hypothetical protein
VVVIEPGTGVWRITVAPKRQLAHPEEMLVNLSSDGATLRGEISSPRMGTIAIWKGAVHGDTLTWTTPVRFGVAIDLEFSLQVQGDTLSGECRSGSYGTSIVSGVRVPASQWKPGKAPHLHRSAVRLPDGTNLTAVSYDAADPYGRDELPAFGLYLDPCWAPPWPHRHLEWPDFGVPADVEPVANDLQDLLDRARQGQRVEIGCLGGHGRTGTALAWLAVLTGEPPDTAVSWVRANYCAWAVETSEQERFVANRLGPMR